MSTTTPLHCLGDGAKLPTNPSQNRSFSDKRDIHQRQTNIGKSVSIFSFSSSLFSLFLDDIRHLSLVTQTRPSRRNTSSTMIYHDLSDSHRHSLYDHSPRPSQVTGFCNGFQMTSESYVANHKLCAVLFDQ